MAPSPSDIKTLRLDLELPDSQSTIIFAVIVIINDDRSRAAAIDVLEEGTNELRDLWVRILSLPRHALPELRADRSTELVGVGDCKVNICTKLNERLRAWRSGRNKLGGVPAPPQEKYKASDGPLKHHLPAVLMMQQVSAVRHSE
jgi:hypothetical protein